MDTPTLLFLQNFVWMDPVNVPAKLAVRLAYTRS